MISEQLCWDVLNKAKGESVLASWLKGSESDDPPIQNAVPIFVIERELVLHYTKSEIEDSLYFLEKRGYLIKHGFSGWTRTAYTLSDSALKVLENESFSEEEQNAFREAVLDLKKLGTFGAKINIGELLRRGKKRFFS